MITFGYVLVLLILAYLFGHSNTARYQKIIIEKNKQIEHHKKQLRDMELRHIREISQMVKRNR